MNKLAYLEGYLEKSAGQAAAKYKKFVEALTGQSLIAAINKAGGNDRMFIESAIKATGKEGTLTGSIGSLSNAQLKRIYKANNGKAPATIVKPPVATKKPYSPPHTPEAKISPYTVSKTNPPVDKPKVAPKKETAAAPVDPAFWSTAQGKALLASLGFSGGVAATAAVTT